MAGVPTLFTQVSPDFCFTRPLQSHCLDVPNPHQDSSGTIHAQNGKFAGVFFDKVINLLLEHT